MASFGPKPSLNPCGKMAIFLTFLTSCFYNLEKRFFVLEYRKRQFSYLFYLKKKEVGKMAIFGPKPWVHLVGIMAIFRLFERLFL